MSGKDAAKGEAMVNGAALMVEEYNQQRGPDRPKLQLSIFDDKNSPELATIKALEIVDKGDMIAVIGHRSSPALLSRRTYL